MTARNVCVMNGGTVGPRNYVSLAAVVPRVCLLRAAGNRHYAPVDQ
ncbi:MAG TPA: hypothetical protein VFF69_14290 [Phycisphaerales bacterium]|nr:hypothetical protein [Phycisphaerales bacterium]